VVDSKQQKYVRFIYLFKNGQQSQNSWNF